MMRVAPPTQRQLEADLLKLCCAHELAALHVRGPVPAGARCVRWMALRSVASIAQEVGAGASAIGRKVRHDPWRVPRYERSLATLGRRDGQEDLPWSAQDLKLDGRPGSSDSLDGLTSSATNQSNESQVSGGYRLLRIFCIRPHEDMSVF